MIPALRQRFNREFTPEKYALFQQRMAERCGMTIPFRLCETPCFFPRDLIDQLCRDGEELIRQLDTPEYLALSANSIPPEFNVPNESRHPMFIQVDFGLVRDASGKVHPKLVELQAFPSLYAYQTVLSQEYLRVYGFEDDAGYLLSGLSFEQYRDLLRRAIVADHDPSEVILMEIDPENQKTAPDFHVTRQMVGIETVDIRDIRQDGRKLSYERKGKRQPIKRIYNRAIVDELVRKGVKIPFELTQDLDVEWAGHPNWYFRISKLSLPYLHHKSVPKTWFLDQLDKVPDDLENYVLKPLFSFAGLGVVLGPSREELDRIRKDKRHEYILQERVTFTPVIDTPHGPTKAELRIMYIWLDKLTPVMCIVRMGRGSMMGVDQNKNMEWVGSSAGLIA